MTCFSSLSGRLTVYSAGTFTFMLLICFAMLYWSVTVLLAQRMDEDLLEDIAEFSHIYQEGELALLNREIIRETAGDEQDSVFLILLDASMQISHASDLSAWDGLKPDFNEVKAQLLPGAEPAMKTLHIESQDEPTRVIYGALSDEYVLVLGESTEERQDIKDLLIVAFSIVFLIAVPAAAMLVWLVTRRTVSGINRVSDAAGKISKGELSVRVNAEKELDEVQTLADTFDAMAGRIQSLIYHMREMTDNIAHDLRSPLGRIRLLSESMLRGRFNDKAFQENAANTILECDRLIEMIDLSLDVAEAEAGVLTLNTVATDISVLVQDACDFFEPAMELKRISLNRSIQSGCHVMADSNSLQRLLSNLLDNALKYTPPGGVISVTTHCGGGFVNVLVSDNGIGIPAVSIDHVFDRFYRAEPSRGGKGCGLGLSFSQAVAKAHGGELCVESTPGRLTVFSMRLPSIDPRAETKGRNLSFSSIEKDKLNCKSA